MTNNFTELYTRSGLKHLMKHKETNISSIFSLYPRGISTVSGASKSYQCFHTEESAVKSLINSAMTGFIPAKHNKSFQPVGDNQSVGFTSIEVKLEVEKQNILDVENEIKLLKETRDQFSV